MQYELDFISPEGSSIMFVMKIPSNISDNILRKWIREQIRSVLYRDYLHNLLNNYSFEELYNLYNNNIEVSIRELEKIIWHTDLPKYKCLSISKIL